MPRGRHREVADLPLDQDVLQVRAERDDPADDRVSWATVSAWRKLIAGPARAHTRSRAIRPAPR